MIFNTDSYYAIGSSHSVCQDYSLSGLKNYNVENDTAFALITDGCSASENTDFGARLLAKCAEHRIKWFFPDEKSFRLKTIDAANYCVDVLDLNKECLDATLLFIQADFNGYEIRAYGDGGILKLGYDGSVEYIFIEYPSGAPLYLNYYSNEERFERYKSMFGLKRHIHKWKIDSEGNKTYKVDSDENGEPYVEYGSHDYKVIAVVSDGIASFVKSIDKTVEPANMIDVVTQIMDIKGVKGKFVHRIINGLNRFCEKNSLKHTDDFSIAGISFEKKVI